MLCQKKWKIEKPLLILTTSLIAVCLLAICLLCLLGKVKRATASTEEWFPYSVSGNNGAGITAFGITTFNNETVKSAVDGSCFLDAPAGKYGFIRVKGDHFVFDNGKRIRFWGASLAAGACFPTHENARILAEELAQCGFNAVRFHHMDSSFAPAGIIDRKTQELSAEQLDRLDYFIYQLKKNGIYSDLNLHVGRNYSGVAGVFDGDKLPTLSKVVTLFDDTIIGLEKDFAEQLLTHFNKYTNTRYCDEPAICFIEITNENSIFPFWNSGALFGEAVDKINFATNLTPHYINKLDKKWNEFLINKYKTQQNLQRAWQTSVSEGKEFLISDDSWILEKHEGITAKVVKDEVEKYAGNYSMRVDAEQVDPNTSYKLQLKRLGIKVEKEKTYLVEFYAKADSERDISVNFMRDVSPYNNYGLNERVNLTTQWRRYSFYLRANESTDDLTRLSFILGSSPGKFWINNVILKPMNPQGLLDSESLETGNISRLKWNERVLFSHQKLKDSIDFYCQLEKDFFTRMVSYLHNNLQIKCPVSTTNSFYGQPNLLAQQEGDYIDSHVYWDHPQFPNRIWDKTDFKQHNLSLIRSTVINKRYMGEGFLDRLALSATKGKPMVVSEWNYVFPNTFEYEAPIMVVVYGASQDWDGLFIYNYTSRVQGDISRNNSSSDYIDDFYAIRNNPSKKAQMLQCAIAFYRGDIKPDQKEILINYNDDFTKYSYQHSPNNSYLYDGKRLPYAAFYNYKIRNQFNKAATSKLTDLLTISEIETLRNEKVHCNDTGEIKWDGSTEDKEYLSINTPNFQSLNGFIANTEISLENLTAKVSTDCAIGLISLDNKAISNSRRMLLTVVGRQKNTNQVKTEKNGLDNWGTSLVLMERVRGKIRILQDYMAGIQYKVYALNEKGERVAQKSVNVVELNNKTTIDFNIGDESLWYEIVADCGDDPFNN